MTYLQLVNNILVRLRLDKVSSVDEDSYSRLMGALVNDAKREVEDAWDWNVLRRSMLIYTDAQIFAYQLVGAGTRYKLLFDTVDQPAFWNVTEQSRLKGPMPSSWMTQRISYHTETGPPLYFDINGSFDGDPLVNLYPVPDRDYQLQIDMVVPQPDLAEDTDRLLVPSYPVLLGAFALAVSERGEDGGLSYSDAYARYASALADAIQIDARNLQNELTSEVI